MNFYFDIVHIHLEHCHSTSSFKFKRELQTAMSDSCALNSLFATWRRTCVHMAFLFMPYDMYQTSLRIRFKFQGDLCSIKEVMTEKRRRPPFEICPFYVIYTNGNWINSCVHICLLHTKAIPVSTLYHK